jgi:2-hydroxyacyl-CoA lyase 1
MPSTGAQLIAKTLKKLGVTVVFGIVGIPIVEVGDALIKQGIKFIAFRNEQSASYAASAYGYLTGKPGVLLVVGGPGLIHALPGAFNSSVNRWPLLILAGSSSLDEVSKGAFQELDQVSFMTPHSKLALKPLGYNQVVRFLYNGYKTSLFGKPGVSYIDLPGNLVEGELAESEEVELLNTISSITPQDVLKFRPEQSQIEKVANVIRSSKSPLCIIGKGSAYANASKELRQLVSDHNLPFLPTPMGKGVIPDESSLNVSSARSKALFESDVILLFGSRLNWILHFGEEPRFKKDVKFIQVDNHAEEIGFNNPKAIEFGLVGDISIIAHELNQALKGYTAPLIPDSITSKIIQNNENLSKKETTTQPQLNYNLTYKQIRDFIKPINDNVILVTEGANTMDVARISFPQSQPRQRLDAGTNATMGVGLGYAIASKAAFPDKHVVTIQGDSAFGFSGLELETAIRSNLPIVIVVMNNSGLYHGVEESVRANGDLPSTALSKDTRYDVLANALGGEGYLVHDIADLNNALKSAFDGVERGVTSLINVIISPGVQKKVGFGWQSKKKGESKL